MKLITIIISTFLILTPFVQAQGFGETVYDTLRDISKMTSILIIDFVYSLRLGILKIKDHLLTDQTDEIIKTKAYWQWELDNLRTEGKCCKSADSKRSGC